MLMQGILGEQMRKRNRYIECSFACSQYCSLVMGVEWGSLDHSQWCSGAISVFVLRSDAWWLLGNYMWCQWLNQAYAKQVPSSLYYPSCFLDYWYSILHQKQIHFSVGESDQLMRKELPTLSTQ